MTGVYECPICGDTGERKTIACADCVAAIAVRDRRSIRYRMFLLLSDQAGSPTA